MTKKLKNNSHEAVIEHVNLSASDPDKLAEQLCQLFNWQVRWSGASMDDGYTVHVCLLYTSPSPRDGLLSRMPSSA